VYRSYPKLGLPLTGMQQRWTVRLRKLFWLQLKSLSEQASMTSLNFGQLVARYSMTFMRFDMVLYTAKFDAVIVTYFSVLLVATKLTYNCTPLFFRQQWLMMLPPATPVWRRIDHRLGISEFAGTSLENLSPLSVGPCPCQCLSKEIL
jgi:hypothetical protein